MHRKVCDASFFERVLAELRHLAAAMASTQAQPYACNRTSTVELQFNDNLGSLLVTLACSVSFAIP